MEQFNCCLIGEDTLLIECGEILLKRGHVVCSIVAQNGVIKQWAESHHLPWFSSVVDLQKSLNKVEIDYLFSIANGTILHQDLLQAPKKFSINYHYSLLPKYAGTYSTSWAILNGETTHGVTWHVMTDAVDAGDILKQIQFPIDKNETAFTLNLKCYEYAVKAFIELVEELENNQFTLTKQDLTLRHYTLLKKRPPGNGVIVWNRSAEEIDKLCRALTLGNYLNQLALPKIIIGECVYNIQELHILDSASKEEAGTIVVIDEHAVHISTLTQDIAISKITDAKGVSYPIPQLLEKHNLCVKHKLLDLKHEYLTQLENIATLHAQHESFWVDALTKIQPGKESFYVGSKSNAHLKKVATINISESIYDRFLINQQNPDRQYILVTVILIYLFRLNNGDNFTTNFSWPGLEVKNFGFEPFFSSHLPLIACFKPEMTFKEALEVVLIAIDSLEKHGTYARDIKIRYPQLSYCLDLNLMVIEIVKDLSTYEPKEDAPFSIAVSENGASALVFVEEGLLNSPYLSELFKNIPGHILSLMSGMVANQSQVISKMQLLSFPERQRILYEWNNTKVENLPVKSVHELFEEQVIKTPNHVALICQDEIVTFQALNEQANQLAHYLRKCCVTFDTPVAICAERSLEMVVGIIAILKAGGAYVPLDPHYPAGRLSFMLENSKAPLLLLSHTHLKYNFQNYRGQVVDLENNREMMIAESKKNLAITTSLDNLAYIIYTSGTTGQPKGVAITHRSLVNHMHWMIPKFHFNESDVFLQKTAFSFDASVWEFFAPLLCGGKLVIALDSDPNGFCKLIQQHQVTVLQLVPSVLQQLLEDHEFQLCHSLQQVFAGGEALLPDLVDLFFTKINAKLHNLYGPTEATIQTITFSYENKSKQCFEGAIIGKPINNTQAYVLDKYLNLVPAGLTGELYLGGVCLARGYLGQEQLTLERFIRNSFSNGERGERLYKTGDVVRWLPDGNLQYIKRVDDQIKLHGLRIELGEIEASLMQHKEIQACAVIVQERRDENSRLNGNKYLVAFYVRKIDPVSLLSPNEALQKARPLENQFAHELKEFLSAKLPSYMVPKHYVSLEKMPLNANGKLDRELLMEHQYSEDEDYVAPRNDLEQKLCQIWARILGLPESKIGIKDDFFNLGGHSLSAFKVLALVNTTFAVTLKTAVLFNCPTIEKFSEFISKVKRDPGVNNGAINSHLVALQKEGYKDPLFLIHPLSGAVFWYKGLAKYMRRDRPIYAIEDPSISLGKIKLNSIPEMASYYLKVMKGVQPRGPYWIAGASLGGTIAIEIAHQILRSGEEVNFVGLMDAWPSYNEKFWQGDFLENLMLNGSIGVTLQQGLDKSFFLDLYRQRLLMLRHYQIPVLDVKLVFFKARDIWPVFKDIELPLNCWQAYSTQPVETHIVPGDHESMFNESNIILLAKKMDKTLNKLEHQKKQTYHYELA